MPGAGGGASKSSQQSSILSFVKKTKPSDNQVEKPAPKPIFLSKQPSLKGLTKPAAFVTPIQINRNREQVVDHVDLTGSPDLLNDDCDEVFNDLPDILPKLPNYVRTDEVIEESPKEESWLTQIYG